MAESGFELMCASRQTVAFRTAPDISGDKEQTAQNEESNHRHRDRLSPLRG